MKDKNYISCLCVTRGRPELLASSIHCFHAQTHKNKQLVIVYESDDLATCQYLESIDATDVKKVCVERQDEQYLGDLRNISIDNADGDFICQWDDDDWYSEQRLEFQLASAINNYKDASLLFYWLIFDRELKKAYLSCRRTWEGSLLCRKSILLDNNIRYPSQPKGEDTGVIDALIKMNVIYPVICPQLYIYTYSGKNTWDKSHFNNILGWCQELEQNKSILVENILAGDVDMSTASEMLFSESFAKSFRFVQELPRHLRYVANSV